MPRAKKVADASTGTRQVVPRAAIAVNANKVLPVMVGSFVERISPPMGKKMPMDCWKRCDWRHTFAVTATIFVNLERVVRDIVASPAIEFCAALAMLRHERHTGRGHVAVPDAVSVTGVVPAVL